MDTARSQSFKSAELSAVITRADGKIEPQGVVAYWHRNPLRRLAYRLRGGKGMMRRPTAA